MKLETNNRQLTVRLTRPYIRAIWSLWINILKLEWPQSIGVSYFIYIRFQKPPFLWRVSTTTINTYTLPNKYISIKESFSLPSNSISKPNIDSHFRIASTSLILSYFLLLSYLICLTSHRIANLTFVILMYCIFLHFLCFSFML